MRDSCVFYRSFFEAIKVLPKENQAEIYNAIFEHAFNFNEVELEGINLTVMTLIKPQINANIRKYENDNDNVQTAIVESVNRSLVAGEMPIREIAKEIAEGNQFGVQREAIMMKYQIKKIDVFRWALSKFNIHKRSKNQLTETHNSYFDHLDNWLRKQDIQTIHQDYYQELKRQTENQ